MRILVSILLCGCVCVVLASAARAEPGTSGVSVMSASDSSPERLDARTRTLHGQIARRAASDTLQRTGIAARPGSAAHQLDVSVIGWSVASAEGLAAVTAE